MRLQWALRSRLQARADRRGGVLGPCAAQVFDLARLNKAPIAIEAVARIDVLFAIEREINAKHPSSTA